MANTVLHATPMDDRAEVAGHDFGGWFPLSWGAIACGVVVALAVQLLLGLLGTALGFSAVEYAGQTDVEGAAHSAFWWWALSGLVASFCGGLAAGATTPGSIHNAYMNAFVAWCTTLLFVALAISALATGAISSWAGPVPYLDALASETDTTTYRDLIATLTLWSFVILLVGLIVQVLAGRIGFKAEPPVRELAARTA
jgi:cytochrome bd-type quinol oxidase subunit 2